MTLVAAERPSSPPAADRPPGIVRRIWGAPLWAHVLALGFVLVALLPLIGTNASFSADEGAAIVQAQSLSRGDGWIVEHPLPQIDPTGANYPLELSERGPSGFAPFAKHPLYALALSGADRLGGVTAMVLLSVAGTLAAAGLAAALARRIDLAVARPTLWVVGLASPLLFDGYLVMAHTLGAAAATGAVLMAVIAVERRSLPVALSVAPCVAAAVLLRNEAVFFAAALAAAAVIVGIRRARLPMLVVAAGALLAGGAAHLAERAWTRVIAGGGAVGVNTSIGGNGERGFVAGRVKSFLLTWLTPDYHGARTLTLALILMLLALMAGALVARRRADTGAILLCSVLAGAAALIGLGLRPTNLVPGLLVAFPLMLPALVLLRRSQFGSTTALVAAVTFALFSAAVIATQYERGGTSEWGGRYFALGIPLVVPLLLVALRDAGRRLDPVARRWAVASLVACSLAMATMSVTSIRSTHHITAALMTHVDDAAQDLGTPKPLLVTTAPLIPRLSWETFEDQAWLLSKRSDLGDVVKRLRDAGVTRFVFVTGNLRGDEPGLKGTREVARQFGRTDGSGWQVRVLEIS